MPTDRIQGYNAGISVKIACQVATTGANITLSGVQTIDGVSVGSASERVLVKDQTSSTNNGIYTARSSSWIRALDCDGNKDILPGSLVYVDRGSYNNRTFWVFNSSSTATSITVGTNALTLSKVTQGLQQASSWVDTNWLPLTSASSARSVLGVTSSAVDSFITSTNSSNALNAVGGFSSSQLSTWVQTNWINLSSASSARNVLGVDKHVDITWYGAVASSTADSSTAIQAAINAAKGGSLFIPPGTFWVSNKLTHTGSTLGGLTISGAGQGVSEIRWAASSTDLGLALYTSTMVKDFFTVRDLRLTTMLYSTGVALTISSSAASTLDSYDADQSRYLVEKLSIMGGTVVDGGSATASGWKYGFESVISKMVVVNDCTIIGPAVNAFIGSTGTKGMYFHGLPVGSSDNGHPVQFVCKGNSIWFHDYGTEFNNCEGAYVTASNYVANNYGVVGFSTFSHPQCFVTNSHFNANNGAVLIDGMVDFRVTGNLMYQINNSTAMTAVYASSRAFSGVITDNIFASVGTTGMVAIGITGHHVNVSNNMFRAGGALPTCIVCYAGSYSVRGNFNNAMGTPTNLVSNSGTTTNTVSVSSST